MKSFLIALLLASISGMICSLAAGNSLDLFIGGMFFAAVLVGQSPGDWGTVAGITLGVGFVWGMPVHADAIRPGQWVMCCGVMFTFVVMLAGAVRLFGRQSPILASALVTTFALAWLSWPVWLAASMSGSQLNGSVLFHPLFAINHVVSELGIWTEQPAAYGLTNLGQDVEYQLPFSAWPVIAMQSGIGVLMILIPFCRRTAIGFWSEKSRARRVCPQ